MHLKNLRINTKKALTGNQSHTDEFNLEAEFKNLVDINYFVGKANSGKSYLLKTILDDHFDEVAYITDSVPFNTFWDLANCKIDCSDKFFTLTETRSVYLDIFDFKYVREDAIFDQVLQETYKCFQLFNCFDDTLIYDHHDGQSLLAPTESKKIFNLVFWIMYFNIKLGTQVFLIDEPEVHLHPSISKNLPIVFTILAQKYNCQFFVATHSPFVIASVSKLDFEDTKVKQTVYFLSEGRLIDKFGRKSFQGDNGYWGQKLIPISNKLLGSALGDFFIKQQSEVTTLSPILIMCEGQSSQEDAEIYNTIFMGNRPHVLFVSCKGTSQLLRTFTLLTEIKSGLSADFKLYMIRDRDGEFPEQNSIDTWEHEYPNAKILSRRAIESYLFTVDNARELNKEQEYKGGDKAIKQLEETQKVIAQSVVNGQISIDYKEMLATAFDKATNNYLLNRVPLDKHYKFLSKYIIPGTTAYKQLVEDIFK